MFCRSKKQTLPLRHALRQVGRGRERYFTPIAYGFEYDIRKVRQRRGFTLLEVLLVLGILILLAAIVTPNLLNRQQKAMIRTTKISIAGLEGALRLYAAEHEGECPAGSATEVFDLLMNPNAARDGQAITPYVQDLPTDAWGQMLYYEFPTHRHRRSDKPAIWSAGPNEKNDHGEQDDINNWDEVAE